MLYYVYELFQEIFFYNFFVFNHPSYFARCFKEVFLQRKSLNSSDSIVTSQHSPSTNVTSSTLDDDVTGSEEEEEVVVRVTEVSFGKVRWSLTDRDGQLNIAQFEMNKFFYEKVKYFLWYIVVLKSDF